MPTWGSVPDTSLEKNVELTFNMAQNAGTYTVGTVSGGDVLITRVAPFVSVAAGGLVSVALQTNNATLDALLVAAALATLTAGKNLAAFQTPFLLPSTKLIQAVIVGNGNAGTLLVGVTYRPLTAGAVLA